MSNSYSNVFSLRKEAAFYFNKAVEQKSKKENISISLATDQAYEWLSRKVGKKITSIKNLSFNILNEVVVLLFSFHNGKEF